MQRGETLAQFSGLRGCIDKRVQRRSQENVEFKV